MCSPSLEHRVAKLTEMLNIKNSGILCEGCRAADSSVYCREDSSYLCITCDSRTHNTSIRHERVLLCASCAAAPAVFLCKADSASLCAACDTKIHSANPLAGRHHRVPIQPMNSVPSPPANTFTGSNIQEEDEEEEAVSWLLLNPINSKANNNGSLRYSEFLELTDFGSSTNLDEQSNQQQDYNVPQRQFFQLGLEYEDPKAVDFFSASSFYITPGMVPDTTTTTQVSFTQQLTEASDAFPSCPLDREARVLRYREKKKNRKFEKTIRYASRKAYAEVRPRIKGRFVKQAVQVCCNTMMGTE